MSTTKLEHKYRCWNDCKMSGCPSHIATLEFQSVSDSFVFDDGKGQKFYGQTPEFGALLAMLVKLKESRVEVDSMIKEAKLTQPPKDPANAEESDELKQIISEEIYGTRQLMRLTNGQRALLNRMAKKIRLTQANYIPKPPAVQGDDWLDEILNKLVMGAFAEGRRSMSEGYKPKVDISESKAAIQAEVDAAYQRGRIDEAKTCEEAKRHEIR